MNRFLRVAVAPVALIALLVPADAGAQPHAAHRVPVVPDELLTRTPPLREGIGTSHDAVATASPQAQRFYDQGLAYLHSYVWIEAARSFHEALRHDANLAIAHAALSVAYTELNAPAKAAAALERARALASPASAKSAATANVRMRHDRAHIDARALQMKAEAAPGDSAALVAYRTALDKALAAFPDDAELWLLRGIAESPDPADRGQGSTPASVKHYDKALALGTSVQAAHHYLAHAYENAGVNDKALASAHAFAKAAPAVPHAVHMHGHMLRRTGRIDEAISVFETADRLASEYQRAERVAPELDWHYEHNLDLLASSYRYTGQLAKAEATLKRSFALSSSLAVQMFNKRAWPEFLGERARTAEALTAAATLIANPSTLVQATGHVAAGHAHLAAKQYAEAAASTNKALAALRGNPAVGSIVGPAFEALQGEFFLRTGQREKGRAILQEAARKARALPGPDNWVQALFTLERMARAARDAGDWEFAGWAARQMLEHDPNYGGSHQAAGLVAQHAGDAAAAAREFAAAKKLWAKADPGFIAQ